METAAGKKFTLYKTKNPRILWECIVIGDSQNIPKYVVYPFFLPQEVRD